jgi:hypothetical protein
VVLVGAEFESMSKISNQEKAKIQNQVLTGKKIYRALQRMSKSLIPQGENINYDEAIMGKEIQLISQNKRE